MNDSNKALRKYVKNHPELSKSTISFSNFYHGEEIIREKALESLLNIIFHDFEKVDRICISVMKTSIFANEADKHSFYLYRNIRHDVVHRNGKNRVGVFHEIGEKEIDHLAGMTLRSVEGIERAFEREYPGCFETEKN